MSTYVSKDNVLDAEILWALKSIQSHFSYNSSEGTGKLFKKMFPDSSIANQFACGATKCAYICCFGLAPYFKNCLFKCLNETEHYTVLFDETLNKSTQSKQMDIQVRFWHTEECKIKTCYLTSAFIGHARADDLLAAFYESVDRLKLSKILQLSMDGPSVNWKFFDCLQADLKKEYNNEAICIGSCELHILNNAFKHGEKSTGWNICGILTSLYWLFKDSPARREDFSSISSDKKFPVKFCNYRWLENVPAVDRAIQMWPDVIRYIKNVEKGVFSANKSKSYITIYDATKDKLIVAKFHFFLSIAKIIQPFLQFYQSDAPLLPFFSSDMVKLVRHCVEHFGVFKAVHSENLSSAIKLCKVNFSDKTLYNPSDKISMGFSADKLVKQLLLKKDITDKEAFNLRYDCQKFVVGMLQNLMNKNPINYSLVRSSSCFDPRKMASKPSDCQKSLKKVLVNLVERNVISDNKCDDIILQFNHFLENVVSVNPSAFNTFDPEKSRLDTFLHKFTAQNLNAYDKIWHVMKIIMTLSHGQASIERGFSVNKNLEKENLIEESYIAQRLIADAISSYGDVLDLTINKEMRGFVSSARQRYMLNLERKQKEKMSSDASNKRKLLFDEIESLKTKKLCLERDISSLEKESESLSVKAEEKVDISLFIKSNSFRKAAKERSAELIDVEKKINMKAEELRKFS